VLQIIASQTAISLENVRIYEDLEQRVRERTEELSIAKEEAEDAKEDAEDALQKTEVAYKELKVAQARLVQSEKMASLGELVAGIAHEINTPLGVGVTGASLIKEDVRSLSDASRDGELTEEQFNQSLSSITETSSVVLGNLKRAADLINSFKQISGDQHHEEKREFQISDYISSIIETLSIRLKKGGGSMSFTCEPGLSISSTPGYFYQIFSNLIINSIDHGFDRKKKGEITLDIKQIDKSIVFMYRDNGKGMSKEEIKKVFDPFFTTKRGGGNTGLGMHIVYNLVNQKLGGEISCSSSPGSGVEFKIVVPNDYDES
ncbi:MAG: HAMP domain-containing histidine kinase, partial [Proteobacteria bacterium]|nr:HAMP domain-containing histidine kinase [Pseudomonadota bacterium]